METRRRTKRWELRSKEARANQTNKEGSCEESMRRKEKRRGARYFRGVYNHRRLEDRLVLSQCCSQPLSPPAGIPSQRQSLLQSPQPASAISRLLAPIIAVITSASCSPRPNAPNDHMRNMKHYYTCNIILYVQRS